MGLVECYWRLQEIRHPTLPGEARAGGSCYPVVARYRNGLRRTVPGRIVAGWWVNGMIDMWFTMWPHKAMCSMGTWQLGWYPILPTRCVNGNGLLVRHQSSLFDRASC